MPDKASSNQSIERMFRIIETMASVGRAMRLNDIALKSNISASTAMRILNAMIEGGYAEQDSDTQFYSLSYKFLWIGNSIKENLTLNQLLHPYLREITKRTNLSCALAILDKDAVTYVDEVVATAQMLRVYHHLGKSHAPYCNACGKLFLSQYTPSDLNRYFQRENLVAVTPKTLCTRKELEENIELICKNGYSVNDEEGVLGMRCIAFPLKYFDGSLFACISISGTIYQITHDNIPVFVSTVQGIIDKLYEECRPVLSQMQNGEFA